MKPCQKHLTERNSRLKKFWLLIKSPLRNKTLSFRFFLLFFGIFFWFSELFIQNNIQVQKVVVDTKDIMKSGKDLLNAKDKTVCFFKDTGFHLAEKSPKNTVLSKIFYQKTLLKDDHVGLKKSLKNTRCILSHTLDHYRLFRDDMILVTSQIEGKVFLMALSELAMVKKIWLLDRNIQDYNVVIYYTERLEYTKKLAKFG